MIDKLKKINFPTSAVFQNKKVALFVTAFNRPQMLEKVVTSMNNSDELESVPIFIYLDGGSASKQQENLEAVKKLKFKNKFVIKRNINLGCDKNTIEMFNDMFVHLGFDYAFHVEDDYVFCKNYFSYSFNEFLRIQKEIDPNIGVFQGFSICFLTPEDKKQKLSSVSPTEKDHLWGCLFSKEAFLEMKKHLIEYEKIVDGFPTNGYSKQYMVEVARLPISYCYDQMYDKSEQKMSEYVTKTFYKKQNEHFTAGWDGAFVLSLACTKFKRYLPTVNRMINIGDVGHHYTKAAFEHYNLHKITLDEVW